MLCVESRRAYKRQHAAITRIKVRQEIMSEYGGRCDCCGENNSIFLSIDHIAVDGAKHRATINSVGGSSFYAWLKRNGFPKDNFRLLCYNCNHATGAYGVCPHKGIIERETHAKRKHFRLRLRVIAAYGSKCVCCGETEPSFLTIDHVNGGGKTHHKQVGFGSNFYYWLQRNNFPQDGFQLLCQNCNHIRQYSDCPHKREV